MNAVQEGLSTEGPQVDVIPDEDEVPREPLTTGAAWVALGCVVGAWLFVIGLVALARGCAS